MKKINQKVSVVVATYKREEILERALKSLINQTYKNVEIILVDDNAEIIWNKRVERVLKKIDFSVVYIQNKKNLGSAETRNIGIARATGQFITFLDDDDIYLPEKISNQLQNMLINKSDFSVTDLKLYSENGRLIEIRKRNYIQNFDVESLLRYHLKYHITGTDTMMFKADYLKKIGGFDSIDVGDEFYLMQKAIEAGGKFSYLNDCNLKAYVHTGSDSLSSGESKIKGENLLYKYKKKYFKQLRKEDIKYVKMRHYMVLGYTEIRRKNFLKAAYYSLQALLIDPLNFLKVVLNRKGG